MPFSFKSLLIYLSLYLQLKNNFTLKSKVIALKQVYYQGWNRSPAQAGCVQGWCPGMTQTDGTGWGGRWEGGSGWGTHVNPWLIHVNVWQKPLQYCKVISLQLIKINEKKARWIMHSNDIWLCKWEKMLPICHGFWWIFFSLHTSLC